MHYRRYLPIVAALTAVTLWSSTAGATDEPCNTSTTVTTTHHADRHTPPPSTTAPAPTTTAPTVVPSTSAPVVTQPAISTTVVAPVPVREIATEQRSTPAPAAADSIDVVLGEALVPVTAAQLAPAVPVQSAAAVLPFTGDHTRWLAVGAAVLILLGLVLVCLQRLAERRAAVRALRAMPPGRGWAGLLEDLEMFG